MSDPIKQWWEKCHSERGNYFVSDFGGKPLWQAMNIVNIVRPFRNILEIGVGRGTDVKKLKRRLCRVYALDICVEALQRVRTKASWLSPNDLPMTFFDLAISHLVTQHIDNSALECQMRNVLRSLKPEGLFAMQFASAIADSPYTEDLEYQRGGGVCRTPTMINDIVSACGGKVTWSSEPIVFQEEGCRWHYVHIRPIGT